MGRPPAYIFIVRHGNRLDAADKLWHLSSPTPYDPPLTYGGWSQCRAIGQRIADILRENAPLESASSLNSPATPVEETAAKPPKKRRYKIVIHSSPFLRCVQTSVAISSGIASDTLPLESPRTFEPLPPLHVRSANGHAPLNGREGGDSTPRLVAPKLHKSVMRLDAFLGEWLSPGYFELITPPPSSDLMVASAKAELLRREDYSSLSHTSNHHQAYHVHSNSTSQLWGTPRPNTWSLPSDADDFAKSDCQVASPPGLHNSSAANGRPSSSNGNLQNSTWGTDNNSGMHSPVRAGYIAPVPHFALSSKAPTPTGYVAHARDSCVDLDYQWDSMRPPYDWGDGGEFGEEWTSMHRRFRKGLQRLVDWYSTTEAPTEMVTKTVQFKAAPRKPNPDGTFVDDEECAIDDDDGDADASDDDYIEESVVVLVSHGAGCNALVGAITQQPVLVDVGLASLSVAARRPGKEELPTRIDGDHTDGDTHSSKWTGAVHSGHPGGVVPLDKYYEMKLLANADHLRSIPSTPTTPRLNAMASVMGGTRGRHSNSLSGTLGNTNFIDSGVMGQRSTSAGSFHGDSDVPLRRPSGASSRPGFSKVSASDGKTSPSGTGGRASGGITIGSGVLTFSPPSISTSRLGRSRALSVGLWSPTSGKDSEEESFGLNDDDENYDDDMEILLSFGPETTAGPEAPKKTSPPPTEKKKAPSIRDGKSTANSSRSFSPLSISHTASGENDATATGSDNQANAERALDKAVRAGLPQLDIKAAVTNGGTRIGESSNSTGSPSPSLWTNPRVSSSSLTSRHTTAAPQNGDAS